MVIQEGDKDLSEYNTDKNIKMTLVRTEILMNENIKKNRKK